MVNLNGSNIVKIEANINGKCNDLEEDFHNLIWTMKAVDYMNQENQENLSRVHVLCCNKCEFLTISLKSLQQHMIMLHSVLGNDFNNLTIYSCQQCKCVSTELKLIQEHIKIFHKHSAENSSISEKMVNKKTAILTPSLLKNCRKPNHLKLVKTQMKMRKKLLQRKSLKLKVNNFLSSDIDVGDNNHNNCAPIVHRDIKMENVHHNTEIDMSQDIDVNDPLDMSVSSVTCPFKGTKREALEARDYLHPWKQEPITSDQHDNSLNNLMSNNPLLSNPQTCIELIKLTLNQMLNKSSEQNRLSHLGFNPSSFLQTQFQLPPNIVPLLLPAVSQIQTNNLSQSQNEMSFSSKNLEIENILANIQQQNLLSNATPKSYELSNQMMSFQQAPLFMSHKMVESPTTVATSVFMDNPPQKNGNLGNLNISPLYNSKKSADLTGQTSNKRNLKKQSLPSKIRNGANDESLKTDSLPNNENLFNRSFLDSTEMMDQSGDHIDMSNTSHSNKSSPNHNDKPHRQNFTSQQNRILSDWFFTHCDKPYPSTEDTKDLSQISGLSYSQVKKWFANKRARSSLNKKSHKSYCLVNPTESSMDEIGNNDLLSVSPSSEPSHRSYSNQIDPSTTTVVTSRTPAAIDFTIPIQEDQI